MKPLVWANSELNSARHTFRSLGVDVQPSFEQGQKPAAIKMDLKLSSDNVRFTRISAIPLIFDGVPLSPKIKDTKNEVALWVSVSDLLILDLYEAETILGYRITSHQSMQKAAHELLCLGCHSVFLLGGHFSEIWCHDYWCNQTSSFWLTQRRFQGGAYVEGRSIFSAATTVFAALGYSLKDALILAKMYVHQVQRNVQEGLDYGGFPESEIDLPYLAASPLEVIPEPFRRSAPIGLYPIVDSVAWVAQLLSWGVKTLQLRIKSPTDSLEAELRHSIALAKKYRATLYINDYWELALSLDADGVHLGQSDLVHADIEALRKKSLLLGISTHCYYEVARAHAIRPSYLAIGPIYPTTSKNMPFLPQGVERLHCWQQTLSYPLVAIGGINRERLPQILKTGVDGVALISAISKAPEPRSATEELLSLIYEKSV